MLEHLVGHSLRLHAHRVEVARIISDHCDIAECAEDAQAYDEIRLSVVDDLREGSLEQVLEEERRQDYARSAGRIVEHRRQRLPPRDAYEESTQLVDAIDGRAGVVHGRGDRLERNIDQLESPELDVLLHGAHGAKIDCLEEALGSHLFRLRESEERNSGRYE